MLRISKLTFDFIAINDFISPKVSGFAWHSAFGKALFKHSCSAKTSPCRVNRQHCDCTYSNVFKTYARYPTVGISLGQAISPPHIFFCDKQGSKKIQQDQIYKVEMLLVGYAHSVIGEIISSMSKTGLVGIGEGRNKLRLESVSQSFFDASPSRIIWLNGIRKPTNSEINKLSIPERPERIRLTFVSPYIQSNTSSIKMFDLSLFLRSTLRAVLTSLHYLEQTQEYVQTSEDKQTTATLFKNASDVKAMLGNLEFCSGEQYSLAKSAKIKTSGWLGYVELSGADIACIWPYLWVAQWLGVGKFRSKGFGQFRIQLM